VQGVSTTIDRRPAVAPAPWRQGAADMAPLVAAVVPFGIVVGAAVSSSPDPVAAWSTGPLLYGGSAQLAVIGQLAHQAPAVLIVAVAVVTNLRLALYGYLLEPVFRDQPRWFRCLGPYFVIDPQYAVVAGRLDDLTSPADLRRYYLGAAGVLWLGWQAGTAVGMVLGPVLPAVAAVAVVSPAYLAAMVGKARHDRATTAAVVTAGGAGLLGAALPAGLGLVVAIALGAAVARAGRS
jgi:predicted branched-subunit amino acid permease